MLEGANAGLIVKLKEDLGQNSFVNLSDPCHTISLAISEAIDCVPNDILNFVNNANSYFNYSP